MKNKYREEMDSIYVSDAVKEKTMEKMMQGMKHKNPVLKYAACLGLAVVIIFGIIIIPKAGGELPNFSIIVSADDGTTNKDIKLLYDPVHWALVDKLYNLGGTSGGNGTVTIRNKQFNFSLRCTGEGIKKVTYTANNCMFMKKTFLSKEQYESGDGSKYVDGSIWGSQQYDKSWIYWGFSSIGTTCSANYLEKLNLNNLGLQITYIDENPHEFKPFTKQESEKLEKLRAAAYDKAYITAEIEFENGRKVTKTIKIGNKDENGTKGITAYLAD